MSVKQRPVCRTRTPARRGSRCRPCRRGTTPPATRMTVFGFERIRHAEARDRTGSAAARRSRGRRRCSCRRSERTMPLIWHGVVRRDHAAGVAGARHHLSDERHRQDLAGQRVLRARRPCGSHRPVEHRRLAAPCRIEPLDAERRRFPAALERVVPLVHPQPVVERQLAVGFHVSWTNHAQVFCRRLSGRRPSDSCTR